MTDRNFTTLNPSKQAKKKQVYNKLDTHTFAERAKAIRLANLNMKICTIKVER